MEKIMSNVWRIPDLRSSLNLRTPYEANTEIELNKKEEYEKRAS
jgi:hypothetical protein